MATLWPLAGIGSFAGLNGESAPEWGPYSAERRADEQYSFEFPVSGFELLIASTDLERHPTFNYLLVLAGN